MQMTSSSPNDTPEFQSEECRRLIKTTVMHGRRSIPENQAKKKKPASTKASRSVASAAGKKKRAPASDLSQRSKKKARWSSDNQFEVAHILDSRGRGTKREFFVEWRGFSADDSTWEPSSNILDPALIKEFENTRRRKQPKRS